MKLMRCNKNAAILFLALVAFTLVSINVYLLGNLQRKEKWESERTPVKFTELPTLNMDYKSLPVESSGQYKIQLKFLQPKTHSSVNQFDVSLVTHCTSNHLHNLLDLVNHWKGPISLAVFVPGHDIVRAFRSLQGIYLCSEAFRGRVTVHLVYPSSHPPAGNVLKPHLEQALHQLQGSCEEIVARLRNENRDEQKDMWNYANVKVPYPNNLLRNVGRSIISQRSYVFVVDVDLLCNGNLYHGFLELAEHLRLPLINNDKRVFVVPAFESANKLPPSLSKQDLIKLWEADTIQPFYYKACWKCQRHLDYDAWRSFHSSGSGLQLAYTVDWKDPWEPFYIGPNGVPRYDERFKQYGFNRISQVCETHFAGYDFVILDNAFVIHHGLKPKEGFHSSKDEENSKNRDIFRAFKKELKSKYPQSTRHC